MERERRGIREVKGPELRHTLGQAIANGFGDGAAWFRGKMIRKGSFGSVFVATLKKDRAQYGIYPSSMAVKSAEISVSVSIQKEKEVICNLKGCPYVIRCFGEEITRGVHGEMVYNLLLELATGGTLVDVIKNSGGNGLPELNVKYYTRSILRALKHIHDCGYVHCDLNPDNIFLVRNSAGSASAFTAKIGNFGLTKRAKSSKKRKFKPYPMGNPVYWSPEIWNGGIQGPPSDVWALGLIVLEMLTGKPLPVGKEEPNCDYILNPRIPNEISKEGKRFLKACFAKKTKFRFTAERLLVHPFVNGLIEDSVIGEVAKCSIIDETDSFLVLTDSPVEDELSCSSSQSSGCDQEESFTYLSDEAESEIRDVSLSRSAEVASLQPSKRVDLRSTSWNAGFHQSKSGVLPSEIPPA